MQIKYKGADKFELKTKDAEVLIGKSIKIGDFDFAGPGEYEKSGVILNGVADADNTIYLLTVEEMKICHLGHLAHDLSEEESKQIGDVDILFLPLGAEGSAELKIALKVLSKIDPRIIIPMLYSDLSEFKKTEGVVDGELDILKIRKIDLPEEERKVVILQVK